MKNQITLKELTLINFKGILNKTISFDQITNVFGDNGTGKTSIFDAFVWLFFGKDSTDRKDFQVKTLDKDNNIIPKIEHEVSATVVIDGREIIIRRIMKENWVTKRGSEVAEFSGNETSFFWDGVPMLLKDFTARVNAIMDEQVFKLITNPLAFNSMKWEERRNVLIQISDGENFDDLAGDNPEYQKLVAELNQSKTIAEYKKQVASTVALAKQNIKLIPTRIDEVTKSKPEAYDFNSLRTLLEVKEGELNKLDEAITNKSGAFDETNRANNENKTKASNLKYEIEQIQVAAKREAQAKMKPDTSAVDGLRNSLSSKQSDLAIAKNTIVTLQTKVAATNQEILYVKAKQDAKRDEWHAINGSELIFNDGDFCCPTCKREFEESDKAAQQEQMKSNFIAEKQRKLAENVRQGAALGSELIAHQTEVTALENRITTGKNTVSELDAAISGLTTSIATAEANVTEPDPTQEELIYESILSMNPDYKARQEELATVTALIVEVPRVDTTELKAQKSALQIDIDGIKNKLRNEAQIAAVNARIEQLDAEEKTLANEISTAEKLQFTIDNFNKLRVDTLERKINERFKFVSFKMFEQQINGGEKECCEALIDGVPFSDANTASKINAGLDIINTLCDFYHVTAPIFIDNRESVVKLIDTESQIINLIVSENDKALRIEAAPELQKAVA